MEFWCALWYEHAGFTISRGKYQEREYEHTHVIIFDNRKSPSRLIVKVWERIPLRWRWLVMKAKFRSPQSYQPVYNTRLINNTILERFLVYFLKIYPLLDFLSDLRKLFGSGFVQLIITICLPYIPFLQPLGSYFFPMLNLLAYGLLSMYYYY